MRLWLHVRNYGDIRLRLLQAGLWLREPAEPPPGPTLRPWWHEVLPTRPLTPGERTVDRMMREVPVAADAAR